MFKRFNAWANQNEGLVSAIGIAITVLLAVIGYLAQLYGAIVVLIVSAFLILGVLFALIWFVWTRHSSKPRVLLQPARAAKLSVWSPNNGWSSQQDILSVTESMFGGICKFGSRWKNYEFCFEFKIVNKCAGWIVRAKSCDHYVMIQCTDQLHQQLRPHIRAVPSEGGLPSYKLLIEIPLPYSLNEWNNARTVVVGHSIEVWINRTLVWSNSDLREEFGQGTIGFRCADDERALFRNIQVVKR